MKFSIIIPVYNAEQYIENTISETLKQSYNSFEIILVDDGSTDRSAEICDLYAQKFPDKIRVLHQKNQGQLAARCKGIKVAQNEYCLFLDADDLFVEDAFSHLKRIIEKYNCPDMVVFPFYYEMNGKLELSRLICDHEQLYYGDTLNELYLVFLRGTLLNTVWCKAVKKEIAVKSTIEFERYTSLRCGEDRYQSMKMFQYTQSVVYASNPLYRYRIAEGSTTRQYTVESIAKFDIKILYEVEKECFSAWFIEKNDWKDIFYTRWCVYPLYVLDLFYSHMPKDKDMILAYPWKDFLPKELSYNEIVNNPRIDEKQKKMWKWIYTNDYSSLRIHFFRKRVYQILRSIKRMMFPTLDNKKDK